MDIFLILIIIITIILTIRRDINGLCCFILVRILIPENVRVFDKISLNTAIILFVMLILIIKHLRNSNKLVVEKKYSMVLLAFIIYAALTLPFSNNLNLVAQYSYLVQFIITEISPAIITMIVIRNKNDILTVSKAFIIGCFITSVYGVLSFILQANPYATIFMDSSQSYAGWRGYSTSSTFVHANAFGYFIAMSLPFCFYLKSKNLFSNKIVDYTIILLTLNAILCKKRSAIICVLVTYIVAFLITDFSMKKLKIFLTTLMVVISCFILVFTLPSLSSMRDFLMSSILFWKSNAVQGVSVIDLGSTWDMRVKQIIYPFVEIKDNPLFGHGFGWCTTYLKDHPFHPILYGFETILSKAICEFGYLGYFVYGFLFYESYIYSKCEKNRKYSLIFIFSIVCLAISTGLDYFYLFFFEIILMHKMEKTLYE